MKLLEILRIFRKPVGSIAFKPQSLDEVIDLYENKLRQVLEGFKIKGAQVLVSKATPDGLHNKLRGISIRFGNPLAPKIIDDGKLIGEDIGFNAIVFRHNAEKMVTEISYQIVKHKNIPERQGFQKFNQEFNSLLTPDEVGSYFKEFLISYSSLIREWTAEAPKAKS